MEAVVESENSIIEIGKEFAFEGMDPSSFKGQTADEYRAFKKGYEEGIRIMQQRQSSFDAEVVQEESVGIKK